MSDQSAVRAELPRTAYLDHTLRRARSAAEQRSHKYVTLEHLLLALLDDPDATKAMEAAGADVAVIRSIVTDAVNNRMAALVVPGGRAPNFSYRFDSLFANASAEAYRIGRSSIDGALAIIAVAKEPETNASAMLAANGFDPQAALRALAPPRAAPRQEPPRPDVPPRAVSSQPPRLSATPAAAAADESMEATMASVRTLLEAEERKENGFAPKAPPPVASRPRAEPQLKTNGAAPRPAEPPRRATRAQPSPNGFAEAPPPPFALEKGQAVEKSAKKGKPSVAARPASRGKAANIALLAKVLESVPRTARVAVSETVEILLPKEEAGAIFGWASRNAGPAQAAPKQPAYRAVTIRLAAPEGGFFVEGLAPETQWLLDWPTLPQEEAFGTWAWTAVPSDSGMYSLTVSISAREVDAQGAVNDIALPDQTIKVRVRGNFWRGFGRYVRAALWMLTGGGLTAAAYCAYALKVTGKLPHLY